MYTYALVVEASENQLDVVLQHPEKLSIGRLYQAWRCLEAENSEEWPRKPFPPFADWLVAEHGFTPVNTVVFNTDTADEWEIPE